MLFGASRICCVGLVVMAPALRKADNAKSYHFPLIDALDIKHLPDLINEGKQTRYCSDIVDFIHSYSCLQSYFLHNKTLVGKNTICRFWISTARIPIDGLLYSANEKCNSNRHKRQSSARDGVDESVTTSGHTMNRDIPPVQDSMGLLNTNTSLDCDFKAHCNVAHQSAFTTVEQELLVMSPKELEDPNGFSIFEVSSDNVEHPLTPPSSRPGSVPVIAASSKGLPSSSIDSLKNIDFHSALRMKAENLMRRLRHVQSQQAELHVVHQLKNFVSHQQRNLKISCQRPQHSVPSKKTKESVNLKTELFHSEDVKNLSTAALVKLVRRLESSQASTRLSHMPKGSSVDTESCISEGSVTKLSSNECSETKRVAGTLLTNLRHLESCIDSDATESSSGGESSDECDVQVNKKGSTVSIRRRAEWKWAVDRASIAARWTWLQAQISDLEYSIRQQTDIHTQLQLSKHPVMFECPVHSEVTGSFSAVDCISSLNSNSVDNKSESMLCLSSGNSKEIKNLSLASKHLTKPVNGLLDAGTNGYHQVRGVIHNSNSGQCIDHSIKQFSSGSSHIACSSSRTRPISSFQKRKLFRTIGLHLSNKKAAQLSTVKCNCNCQCKMLPCALCGGRYNNIQTVDQDVMPVVERISLLDPAFHPVVSFEHEISYDLVVQKLLKYTELSKSLSHWGLHLKKKLQMNVPTKNLTSHTRKSTCRLGRNAAQTLLSAAKLRKNFGGKKPGPKKKLVRTGKRKYVRKKQSDFGLLVKKRPYRRRTLSVASSGSSKPDSPVPSPSYWNTEGFGGNSFSSGSRSSVLQDMVRRRRGENTFDINNIVIPCCVASSARVEKIKYKEIVTPKWRLVEEALPLDVKENAVPDESEDITDEAFVERHGLCEKEEKKRFSTIYTHAHPHGRARSRSRGDIHADSSDGNTPDALSPHQLDILGHDSNSSLNTDSALTHPSTISMFLEDSLSSIVTAYPNMERKRTMSFTKKDWPDESRADVDEVEEVAPYEPYVFPLSDEMWEKMQEDSPHLRSDSPLLSLDDIPPSYSNSPASPESSSNSSIVDDDPCDPEWTVVSERGSHQSLVLKFAKR